MIRLCVTLLLIVGCFSIGITENASDNWCTIKADTVLLQRPINLNRAMDIEDSVLIQYLTIKQFKDTLGKYESWNTYNIENIYGFKGKYQFSNWMILRFAGVTPKKFLSTPNIQEEAMHRVCKHYVKYIYRYGYDEYVGKEIDGVVLTMEGLMLGLHFSPTFLMHWLESNGKINEGDCNITIRDYIKRFECRGVVVTTKYLECGKINTQLKRGYKEAKV